MRAVDGWVELANRVGVGARVGKTEPAFLALDDGKPQAGAALRGIGRLDQRRPVAAAAQQAGGFLPLIATALLAAAGHWWAVVVYVLALTVITLIALAFGPETNKQNIERVAAENYG